MATLYDTGEITLSNAAGADIADGDAGDEIWSEESAGVMDSVTINDKAAKIVKIVVEVDNAAAADGFVYIFSRDISGTWADNPAGGTQDPENTTAQMVKVTVDALYIVDDNTYYFANSDSTLASKLWIAYKNDSADTCTVKVRILYETLTLSS